MTSGSNTKGANLDAEPSLEGAGWNRVIKATYKSQSTAKMRVMSVVGSPTEDSTRIMVTRPALGTLAAPIAAKVAVTL